MFARLILCCLVSSGPALAQDKAADDLRGKIFDARMAKAGAADGRKSAASLIGLNIFYL